MSNKNKKRGILNQNIEEPEVEKNEVIESAPMVIDPEVFETKLFVEEESEELSFEVEPPVEKEVPTPEEEVQIFAEDVVPPPCVCTEPCEEPCVCQDPAPEIVEEVAKFVNDSIIEELKVLASTPRTIESLSPAELKMFKRTGHLPS